MPCEKHGPRDSVDKNRGRRPRFLSLLRPDIIIAKMQMKFINTCGNQVNNIDITLTTTKIVKMFSDTNIFSVCAGSDT